MQPSRGSFSALDESFADCARQSFAETVDGVIKAIMLHMTQRLDHNAHLRIIGDEVLRPGMFENQVLTSDLKGFRWSIRKADELGRHLESKPQAIGRPGPMGDDGPTTLASDRVGDGVGARRDVQSQAGIVSGQEEEAPIETADDTFAFKQGQDTAQRSVGHETVDISSGEHASGLQVPKVVMNLLERGGRSG